MFVHVDKQILYKLTLIKQKYFSILQTHKKHLCLIYKALSDCKAKPIPITLADSTHMVY
jgi:hypothetical protein